MKQTLLSLLMMLLPLMAHAQTVEIDGIYYDLITKVKTAEVTENPKKYKGNVAIPSSVVYNDVTYSVTSIGKAAFHNSSGLVSFSIPNSVTAIGERAFYGCSGLTSVTIPNSVTSIGSYAFYGCSGLTSVTIPNSVTSIGSGIFSSCSRLISVTIPYSVTEIGDAAFYGCTGLNSITIPNSVTSIGGGAFSGCTGLTAFTIPNSVSSIGGETFSGCSGLTSVNIPNSVASIGYSAFSGCSCLKSVTIPNSVTEIGAEAFYGCSGLTSVTIPNSVTSIGSYAFYGCKSLLIIKIGNGINTIGKGGVVFQEEGRTFAECPNLKEVYCDALYAPYTPKNIFENSLIEYATLYLPESAVRFYKNKGPWNKFMKIVGIENGSSLWKDITDKYISNWSFDNNSTEGWIIETQGGSVGPSAGCMRFYDTTYTLSQQLNNLPKGKYRLSVQGFYRAYGDSYEAYINGSENITAYLFAGDNATKLRSVYSEGLRWQGTGNWQIHNDQYYPDNSSSANYAFENRLYEDNILEFEAEGNITIGIRCEQRESQNYCVFDNFKLEQYNGPVSATYKLIYKVDGNVYKTVTYYSGASITPEPAPTKQGYTFSGWSDIPATMPANDVTVTGTFTKNVATTYTLTYLVDGQVYKTFSYEAGATVARVEAPTKEGYTFSGWSNTLLTMPERNVTITGTFTKNAPTTYKLTYMVDGKVYKSVNYTAGAVITAEPAPTKQGYEFSGWTNLPKTMPERDVTVTGTFTQKAYNNEDVAVVLALIMRGNPTAEEMARYDMNHDGELNIGDIILIKRAILENKLNGK